MAERILAEFRKKCPKDAKDMYNERNYTPISHFMVPVIRGELSRMTIGFELVFRATNTGFRITREHTVMTTTTLWEASNEQ